MTSDRDVAAVAEMDQGFEMVADTALQMAAQYDGVDSTEASKRLLVDLLGLGIPVEAAALGVAVLAVRLRRARLAEAADG